MEIKKIKELILEKYSEIYQDETAGINSVMEDIEKMDSDIRTRLENYLTTGEISDIQINDYSIKRLVDGGLNEIAAFLTLSWIKEEPEIAIKAISEPHSNLL